MERHCPGLCSLGLQCQGYKVLLYKRTEGIFIHLRTVSVCTERFGHTCCIQSNKAVCMYVPIATGNVEVFNRQTDTGTEYYSSNYSAGIKKTANYSSKHACFRSISNVSVKEVLVSSAIRLTHYDVVFSTRETSFSCLWLLLVKVRKFTDQRNRTIKSALRFRTKTIF